MKPELAQRQRKNIFQKANRGGVKVNTFLHTLNVLGFLAIIFLVPGLLLGLLFNWLNKDNPNPPSLTDEQKEQRRKKYIQQDFELRAYEQRCKDNK